MLLRKAVLMLFLGCTHAYIGPGRRQLKKDMRTSSKGAIKRRLFVQKTIGSVLAIAASKVVLKPSSQSAPPSSSSLLPSTTPSTPAPISATTVGFVYSDEWTGTTLPLLDIEQAATFYATNSETQKTHNQWPMGRWPDPVLRRVAQPVSPDLFGTEALETACRLLQQTAICEKAVGLAAQQCGINARIIFLQRGRSMALSRSTSSLTMINPRIVERSPETDMRVWMEHCLVLPPTFQATVLRDAWVHVEFQDMTGQWHGERLQGELARAAQHEWDHDRGILVTDHVDLSELENNVMRSIESKGHDQRMAAAYGRYVEDSIF